MTSSEVSLRIRAFLENQSPGILVLRGGWGVGKTYLWRKLLKEAKADKSLWPKLYAYVSLFGVNNSEQLKETRALSYANPFTLEATTRIRQLWKGIKTCAFGNSTHATSIVH